MIIMSKMVKMDPVTVWYLSLPDGKRRCSLRGKMSMLSKLAAQELYRGGITFACPFAGGAATSLLATMGCETGVCPSSSIFNK